jgi:hypothetical protein
MTDNSAAARKHSLQRKTPFSRKKMPTIVTNIERNLYAERNVSGISKVEKALAELKRYLR